MFKKFFVCLSLLNIAAYASDMQPFAEESQSAQPGYSLEGHQYDFKSLLAIEPAHSATDAPDTNSTFDHNFFSQVGKMLFQEDSVENISNSESESAQPSVTLQQFLDVLSEPITDDLDKTALSMYLDNSKSAKQAGTDIISAIQQFKQMEEEISLSEGYSLKGHQYDLASLLGIEPAHSAPDTNSTLAQFLSQVGKMLFQEDSVENISNSESEFTPASSKISTEERPQGI